MREANLAFGNTVSGGVDDRLKLCPAHVMMRMIFSRVGSFGGDTG
jgi:hypothetical protein